MVESANVGDVHGLVKFRFLKPVESPLVRDEGVVESRLVRARVAPVV